MPRARRYRSRRSLPEYRVNITKKIRALKGAPQGELGKAAEAVKEIHKQAVLAPPPLAVTETPASRFARLADLVAPFAKPVGTALAVIVFTIPPSNTLFADPRRRRK